MTDPRPSGSRLLTGSRAAPVASKPATARPRAGRVPEAQFARERLVHAGARVLLASDAPARPGIDELERFVDWEGTWNLRRRLAGQGLALAEGLDLVQREAIGWPVMQRLISDHAREVPGTAFLVGVTADHLPPGRPVEDLVEGVAHQAGVVEESGGVPVLLPLRLLARRRATEDEHVEVYRSILERLGGPVLIDWTGSARLASFEGSFPGQSFERVMALDPAKVRGARMTWLDARVVVRVRRALAERGQLAFTGDDPLLVRWLAGGHPGAGEPEPAPTTGTTELAGAPASTGEFAHAALDLLEVGGPALVPALEALATGAGAAFRAQLEPLEALVRWILTVPARLPSAIAFIARLDGQDPGVRYVGDGDAPALGPDESRRLHELAAAAGLFADPVEAGRRLADGG
jgi:hypothetical protein